MGRLQRIIDPTNPLIRYLLNEISDEDKNTIDERLKIDEEFRIAMEEVEERLIIAYVNHGLSDTNRKLFEDNFLCTDVRKQKLNLVQKYEFSTAPPPARRSYIFNRPISFPTTATLLANGFILILLLFVSIVGWNWFSVKRGEWALINAYAKERPIEGRITGFNYAVFSSKRNNQPVEFDEVKRREAQNLIMSQDNGYNSSLNTIRALGKLALTGKEFDTAVKYFNFTLKKDDKDAQTHNDIAVALMAKERAKESGDINVEEYANALEHLHKAIKLDPNLLDAQFNLALCQQYQMLWRTAADRWKQYIEKDSQSQWAEEARKNLKDIEERLKRSGQNRDQMIKEFPEILRSRDPDRVWNSFKNSRRGGIGSFVLEQVIDKYIAAKLMSNIDVAEEILQSLFFVSKVERDKTGDQYTESIALFYQSASNEQLRKSIEARQLLKSAYDDMLKAKHGDGIPKSTKAQNLFFSINNKAEGLTAQYLLSYLYFRHRNLQLSLSILDEGAEESKLLSFKWLWGSYQNGLFNVNGALTKYTITEKYNKNYISNSKLVEDEIGLLHGLHGYSELYITRLAGYREALESVQEGLALANRVQLPTTNYVVFYILGAKSLMEQGRFFAAYDYQIEGVKASMEIGNPWITSIHYTYLSHILNKQGKYAEAIKCLKQVAEIGKTIPDTKLRKQILTRSYLYMGRVYRDIGNWENSAKSYEEAERFYTENEMENVYLAFEVAKGRFLTSVRRHDYSTAQRELSRVLEQYELHRLNIESERNRNRFFGEAQSIYDIATEFAYFQMENEYLAFDYAELGRARSLLDILKLSDDTLTVDPIPNINIPYSIKPLNITQIQDRMPDKTYLLQYAVLEEKLIVWVVSKNDLKSASINISSKVLNNKINTYLSQIETSQHSFPNSDYKRQAGELYDILIKPIENILEKDYELCIVSDKFLHRLPFASLISPTTGRYFIEDRVIYMSPSANIFIATTEKARQKESVKEEKLLAIGPVMSNSLPDAESQTIGISSLYKSGITILNKNSKESYVRNQLKQADVVDFAMHYIADERSPMLSYLPLADEPGTFSNTRDGKLQTYELYGMNLPRLRLVVLSACQTGIERYYDGEGSISLARTFQAIGVPLVVASMWPVEDYPIKVMMLSFHKYRKLGKHPTAIALRLAQLDMIKSGDPRVRNPYHWAAYTIFGGHSSY